ncbi:unnamed protein product [Blumeria hordei]|uniref:Uncharacterized protein n=2 Tax=Blumeria hordei TaxID=2867405 RepID=A0A383UX86_BLUHO|nr:unnamed protein product [Blumeria hordei]
MVGKHVRFTMDPGQERVVDQKILPYVRNGPKAFYLSNVGPYSDLDIQRMVEKRFKDERFWMGKKMVAGVSTHRRLLLFENNQALNFFDLGIDRGYTIRFNAVGRTKICDFCGKGHDGGTTSCTLIRPCNSCPDLQTRLVQRPF